MLIDAPAIEQCIAAETAEAAGVKTIFELSGPIKAVVDYLRDVKLSRDWSPLNEQTDGDFEIRRFIAGGRVTYREIGGLIYRAQASGLTAVIKTDPPICGMENK